jgi:hypothetical protein
MEADEIYVDLLICDQCSEHSEHGEHSEQGPECCKRLQGHLVIHQATYKGRPVKIIALPDDEPIPANGVLMRYDPPNCGVTVLS